jgi:preprotein translocase SecF subunit
MAISIGALVTRGLNFGIDFRGGSIIEIQTDGPADLTAIRTLLGELQLGDVQVQQFGAPSDVLINIEQQDGSDDIGAEIAQQQAADRVKLALEESFPGVDIRRTEVVGPNVSGELVPAGALSVVVALALMLLYIWWRFEWQFSVGAVLALAHDVILTMGMFAITQLEFNLSIIAAILTIVGYSMNDTVVVYDRIREKMRKYKKMLLEELLNLAINKTLSRTIMTSVTTLLALVSLFILGGEALRGFSFAMIWGVVIGTYSSIFVAAPLLLITGVNREHLLPESEREHQDTTP